MPEKIRKAFSYAVTATIMVSALLLLVNSLRYFFEQETVTEVRYADVSYNDTKDEYLLPLTLNGIESGTEVTVSFSIPADSKKTLFFGTVYAPLRIFANGEMIYEYGHIGKFPSFLLDPPTQYDSVELPDGATDIDMIYTSPNERSTLSVHSPIIGEQTAIRQRLIRSNGISFMLSVLFLVFGLTLAAGSLLLVHTGMPWRALFYPGIFAICAGAWQFGENTLSVYIFQNPTLMYCMDFMGLFLLAIPLYKMGMLYLNCENSKLLNTVLYVLEAAAAGAIFLQVTGLVSFHRSLFFFHFLLPTSILILSGFSLYKALHDKDSNARRFFIPFLVLTLSALLELMNYYVRFLPDYSVIFQAGLLLFTVILMVLSSFYFKNLLQARQIKTELENQLKIQERILYFQKERMEMLVSLFDEIRKQRHDMRHHLHAISELIEKSDYTGAIHYIGSVNGGIPMYSPQRWCDNDVVDSTIGFYSKIAQGGGITMDISVNIPASGAAVSDTDLCVVFGNLLENAIDACSSVSGHRFINLSSAVRGRMIFITMDNSCTNGLSKVGEEFISTKHPGTGVGLRSICSIAEKHSGTAEFTADNGIFRSEVCMKI